MSENNGQVAMTDPIEQSKGGVYGHILRRVIHLSLSFIPFIYFEYGEECAEFVGLELPQLVSAIDAYRCSPLRRLGLNFQ